LDHSFAYPPVDRGRGESIRPVGWPGTTGVIRKFEYVWIERDVSRHILTAKTPKAARRRKDFAFSIFHFSLVI
jgi:hypothetical protein